MDKERIPTGVLTRDRKVIYVGDVVDTVQGTVFKVIQFEGDFYLEEIELGKTGLYDLKPYMSPNLWHVNKNKI